MSNIKIYNILIIGRSGSGKSATTKLLTNNSSIKVANSLKQVTIDVQFYEGTTMEVGGELLKFRILDIPGLDKINNRFEIRQKILLKLQKEKASLHAILYVSSLTERDTIDQSKLFSFVDQLPWNNDIKKQALIPIFTKYDNLILDAQQQDVLSTKKQFQNIFEKMNYSLVWSKRIYWINQTKSLQFKIKTYEEIREKYQKQIQRLVEMMKKNKVQLTAQSIRQIMEEENKYIIKKLFQAFQNNQVPYKLDNKNHTFSLKIKIQPKNIEETMHAVSASSIGIFISRVCQKQISTHFSILLMGIPIALSLLKLASSSFVCNQKATGQATSGQTIMKSYERICHQINIEMQKQWKQINQLIDFNIENQYICCKIIKNKKHKFFYLDNFVASIQGVFFEPSVSQGCLIHKYKLPKFQQQTTWTPQVLITFKIKRFDEENILKTIEQLRKNFNIHK